MNYRVPQPIIDAAINMLDDYDLKEPYPSVISSTTLIDSPFVAQMREVTLPVIKERIRNEPDYAEKYVSDNIWLLMGTALHKLLENAGSSYIKETRFFYELKTANGNSVKVSCKIDVMDIRNDGILWDHKFTSKYTLENKERIEHYYNQLSVNAFILRKNGINVKYIAPSLILRDLMPKDSYGNKFPSSASVELPRRTVDFAATEDYIQSRVNYHLSYENPFCGQYERWNSGVTWAVYGLKSDKRAHRVTENENEARIMAATMNGHVEKREGTDVRCESYCQFNEYCPYWKTKNGKI